MSDMKVIKQLYDLYTKSKRSTTGGTEMTDAKRIRIERKKKIKRVLNYDAEMRFLESFWAMKKKEMNIDEFEELATKTLVDTDQVSDVVLELFVDEEKIKIKIQERLDKIGKIENKIDKLDQQRDTLQEEIEKFENILTEEEYEGEAQWAVNDDPCGRSGIKSNC